MKTLILLRHSKAVGETESGDHARALSGRGLAEARTAGATLAGQSGPDFALVSDSRRTRETFERVAEALGLTIPHRLEPALYGADPSTILRLVAEIPSISSTLLVVGHNPGIGELARQLAVAGDQSARERLAQGFPMSAYAVIALSGTEWSKACEGGSLERFVTAESLSGSA